MNYRTNEILKEDINAKCLTDSVFSVFVNALLIHSNLLVIAEDRPKHKKVIDEKTSYVEALI